MSVTLSAADPVGRSARYLRLPDGRGARYLQHERMAASARSSRQTRTLPGLRVGLPGSHLVGGHDPQFADGGVSWTGDHVRDAVGDVLGRENLGGGVEVVDLFADWPGV